METQKAQQSPLVGGQGPAGEFQAPKKEATSVTMVKPSAETAAARNSDQTITRQAPEPAEKQNRAVTLAAAAGVAAVFGIPVALFLAAPIWVKAAVFSVAAVGAGVLYGKSKIDEYNARGQGY